MACNDAFQGPAYGNGCDAIPDMQADLTTLIERECTDCAATVPEGTDRKDFVSIGFSDELPEADICPVLQVVEGCNVWIAPNDPDSCDLGDGNPNTGLDWQRVIEQDITVKQYMLVEHRETTGTNGGTFTAGAWRTRKCNYFQDDGDNISIQRLAFTSGGIFEVEPGDTLLGATSAATAFVVDVELTSGSWAAGTAAGNFWIKSQTGNFVGENLDVGANNNVATVAADSTFPDQIRLTAGPYEVIAISSVFDVGVHQMRFWNISDSTEDITGISAFAQTTGNIGGHAVLIGKLNLVNSKTFELQHQCGTTAATFGFGLAVSFGAHETYSSLRLKKDV